MPGADLLIPTRKLEEPCARCCHTAGQHHLGSVRSWEYCLAQDCLCPGWCSTLECATCDHGTPRWAGYAQCLACLDYRVLPSDYVYKHIIGFDAMAAGEAIRLFRGEWETKHPGFQLVLDRQRSFPDTVAPSKYSDRHTTLGRKMFYSRWRVARAHPKRYLRRLEVGNCEVGREIPFVFAKDDPRDELSPGIYRTPLDWKSYSVPIPVEGKLSEEVLKALEVSQQRMIEHLRESLSADIFADGWEGVRLGEERFDATCDHCGGFWDGLFPSQESADQWFVQHRAVCLGVPPPPLVGE
mgnify:CR=1 FL=1